MLLGATGGEVEGGELGDADTGDDAGGADGAGALADLDDIGAGLGEEFDTGGAGDIAGDDWELGERVAEDAHGICDAAAVAVGGGDGDGIDASFDEGSDVIEDAVTVKFAEGVAGGGDGGAAEAAEVAIAGGFELGVLFLGDPFDVTESEEAVQVILGIDDQEFMDAGVFGEEVVGGGDGI